jgi:hypothetical protein
VVAGDRVGFYGLGEPSSCGQGGNSGVSTRVGLHDFAIIGEVSNRVDCDQTNAIGGALGGGSAISGMFLQHTKVGLWLDGPFDGLTIRNNKVVDQLADGMNLHRGISNVLIEHNLFRNIGDDGIAFWSEHQADHGNTIRRNTIVVPMKANGIAIYGDPANPPTTTTTTTSTTVPPGGNLARGKAATASSANGGFPASSAVDGDANTYWESANNQFPQSLTVDVGRSESVGRLVLKLPPAAARAARTQTLSVSGSTDGNGYSQVVASAGYRLDPASGNQVTIPVSGTHRHLRVTVTGNTGVAGRSAGRVGGVRGLTLTLVGEHPATPAGPPRSARTAA